MPASDNSVAVVDSRDDAALHWLGSMPKSVRTGIKARIDVDQTVCGGG